MKAQKELLFSCVLVPVGLPVATIDYFAPSLVFVVTGAIRFQLRAGKSQVGKFPATQHDDGTADVKVRPLPDKAFWPAAGFVNTGLPPRTYSRMKDTRTANRG